MKKHSVLTDTEAALSGIEQTTKIKIANREFRIKLLTRAEETTARALIDTENVLTAFTDSNVPQLAFAITHINDFGIEQLFVPETDDERSACEADPKRWRAEQMLDWLRERETIVVEKLWLGYLELKDRVTKSLADLENF